MAKKQECWWARNEAFNSHLIFFYDVPPTKNFSGTYGPVLHLVGKMTTICFRAFFGFNPRKGRRGKVPIHVTDTVRVPDTDSSYVDK